MNEGISILIAGLITGIVTFFGTRMSLKYNFDETILKERLKYYPELLEITQELGKSLKDKQEEIRICKEGYKKMGDWRHKGTGFLILGSDALKYFYLLREKLSKNPCNPQKGYEQKELDKIFKFRSELRKALKKDIGIKISPQIKNI